MIESAEFVDYGFVVFEFVGKENYLYVRSQPRGANSTYIDAVMI